MRIKALSNGVLNEADRLVLAGLLIKAGYTVRLGKEKDSRGRYEHFVEALGENAQTARLRDKQL